MMAISPVRSSTFARYRPATAPPPPTDHTADPTGGRAVNTISHGAIVLDPEAHAVSRNGKPVELSPREFAVLQLLLEQRGKVLSKARLEESLYAWGDEVESNAIEVYVHHLRKKLGAELIRTIRGVGYVIDNL